MRISAVSIQQKSRARFRFNVSEEDHNALFEFQSNKKVEQGLDECDILGIYHNKHRFQSNKKVEQGLDKFRRLNIKEYKMFQSNKKVEQGLDTDAAGQESEYLAVSIQQKSRARFRLKMEKFILLLTMKVSIQQKSRARFRSKKLEQLEWWMKVSIQQKSRARFRLIIFDKYIIPFSVSIQQKSRARFRW